jgi:hypothetical protein
MLPADRDAPLASSRLVRLLARASGRAPRIAPRPSFSARLGEFIDLRSSIRIARSQRKLTSQDYQLRESSGEQIIASYQSERSTLATTVVNKFQPSARTRLPNPEGSDELDDLNARAAYRKFYAARQAELEFKIGHLHEGVRERVSAQSAALEQLCALDASLGNSLQEQRKQLFATVPAILEQRLHNLHENNDWRHCHRQVKDEMRELLLAELETRLMPTAGLVEALQDHLSRKQA